MAKYIVIEQFIDGDDDRVTYPVNAVYPRDGYEPTPERIATLASSNNAKGVPLIRELLELPAKEVQQNPNQEQFPLELSRDDIKAQLDAAGIEYAKNAKTETLLEILEASKLGE
ncbi:hypothetical protein [Streptococcus suis]|uniref:Phage protein n=1 Tax=Streptococcus suis TaxID=1307 RepID=A0A116R286_STRSU|nr:hypothetical protein [Streptococcus suis]MCG9921457.1 hypothetical protein [Streptococcus suis]MCG9925674.1 hypothetical protein [Streptococcus suis]MCG9927675.1 hypothetical protein [Streptococcus suis]MCG9929681.1 hypothetical protein [Streptococcus suis]MCG9936021.1 hypothetical protein [Streptococcus suis]